MSTYGVVQLDVVKVNLVHLYSFFVPFRKFSPSEIIQSVSPSVYVCSQPAAQHSTTDWQTLNLGSGSGALSATVSLTFSLSLLIFVYEHLYAHVQCSERGREWLAAWPLLHWLAGV